MKNVLGGFIALALILTNFSPVSASDWEKSFDIDLTATQSSYSDNWTGGEAGNFTWVGNANGIFNKQLKDWLMWKNSIKLSFGQTLTQKKISDTEKVWTKPVKSSDKIDLESIGLFTTHGFIEPFTALRFESQFLDASDDLHKKYLDPILFTFSAGIAKQLLKKENDDILTRLGFALKLNSDKGFDGTNMRDTTATTSDGGIESNTDVKLVLNERLAYVGKLTLYKAFFYSEKDKVAGTEYADDWKAIDINWENKFTASISKYVVVSLYAQVLYDKQISKKGRFKETLSFGLTYKLL
ncbi:MAG: DUF3078 domain-containing protein [candidate division Zixibacteria bacterium]|nr:DUF3078 domain-containing protein [candidate division Zixibacteria bacterium]